MKRLIVVLIACFFLVSCASKQVKKQGPGELYVDGVNLMKQEQYEKAVHKFAEVTENYPFDPLALVAAVKLGDAHFGKKDYVMAASVYESFVAAHPEDENAPYVILKLGECYEKLSLSIDRDQANTLKAIEKYTFLKNRYPRSNYVKEVDEKLKELEQKLADREMYVGEFYYRTSQYNAAIVRLEYYLKKYPDASGRDKAYFYISSSYKELANPTKGGLLHGEIEGGISEEYLCPDHDQGEKDPEDCRRPELRGRRHQEETSRRRRGGLGEVIGTHADGKG